MAGFYSSAARSLHLTQAAAFPVSDPTSGRRTCKGWPTPAIAAKISRSSHGPEKGPGKGVGHATATGSCYRSFQGPNCKYKFFIGVAI